MYAGDNFVAWFVRREGDYVFTDVLDVFDNEAEARTACPAGSAWETLLPSGTRHLRLERDTGVIDYYVKLVPNRLNLSSKFARDLAGKRKRMSIRCYECREEIVGTARKRFCGDACQRRHWRRRKKGLAPGESIERLD